MEKLEQLVKLLGIDPALVTEEADIKVIVAEFREKFTEELKGTIDNSEAIAKAKEDGGIVAEKRIKKALNAKFQLGLTNTQSDSTPFEKIVEMGAEKIKGSASEDVEKLNDRIIELTNEVNKKDAEKEEAVKSTESEWKGKWKKEKVTQVLLQQLANSDLIIDKDKALKLIEFEANSEGLNFEVDDTGVLLKKGDTKAMKPDNTGHETIESYTDRVLDPFKKKSNGTGTPAGFVTDQKKDTELSPEAQERINQMKSRMGQTVAA